jgi:hypothetical protein
MNPETVSRSRKLITKKLTTGQKITLTPQDDRLLKINYDYISGYAKRKTIESLIEDKKVEVAKLDSEIPISAKTLMRQKGINHQEKVMSSMSVDSDEQIVRSDTDIKIDNYYQAKSQLNKLEEKLKAHLLVDHMICFKDLDMVLKSLNHSVHKRVVEVSISYYHLNTGRNQLYFFLLQQMIWEVDENVDDLIGYDEFQLTYYRNITDTTNNEPNMFFRLMEVRLVVPHANQSLFLVFILL